VKGKGGQLSTDRFFAAHAQDWRTIYEEDDVRSVIHQQRLAQAQSFADRIPAISQGRALDVGCGAGLMTVWLAQRGIAVTAVDTVPSMLDLTQNRVRESGVADRVTLAQSSVQSLPFAGGSFRLVVALGVMMWVPSPPTAITEMARVLQPEGFLLVSISNRLRLTWLLDPLENPFLAPLRRRTKLFLRRMGGAIRERDEPVVHTDTPRGFDQLLTAAGLEKVDSLIFGFGPFTFLHRPVLPKRLAVAVHWRLQCLADRGLPLIRSAGAQYLVLARKPAPRSGR
jgi:ubiquinone/menaquinone biosynthesis C-methylase UbiE